ncbi:MAG: glucose-6-phosphate isomerase [Bacteroidetes bacterium]|nr:glucose-6-phosphate isomerase [Bacteroidota bacterium]
MINIDISNALPFISSKELSAIEEEIKGHHKLLLAGTGKGSDFLGWLRLPSLISKELITRITEDAAEIQSHADVFVVIGIGGSYLGARAVIEALSHNFSLLNPGNLNPHILYAGNNLGEEYHADLLGILDQYSYSVAVISKSGTTTEPAIAFRIVKEHLENKYGKLNIANKIIAITDARKGALKQMADKEGYKAYVIPDNIGGRYSVLTPVGLLPVAVAGFDIEKLISGAREMQERLFSDLSPSTNPAMIYTAMRNVLYNNGKTIELLVNYRPNLFYFSEWWKQLFGESEGKENKGIYPSSASFTTDLHSLGQYIQEGVRDIFETVLSVENSSGNLNIPMDEKDADGLNYIAGKSISEVNKKAEEGTTLAHVEGGVPNIRITVPQVDEETLGQLIYFFEFSCALSGYTLGVNPFDQPGVEAYKKKVFSLLGKKGY